MIENPIYDIPILLITFNRLEKTKQVFNEIIKIKPKKLYLASDGIRLNKLEDSDKVNKVRNFLDSNITWECEVKRLYHPKNLGCKYGPQTAITWFFENEEMGVILEDDCLPSNSFFEYCSNLLKFYQNDLRIFTISGYNFQSDIVRGDASYFFTKFPITWGWATWRNRWQIHLKTITYLSQDISNPLLKVAINDQTVIKAILNNAQRANADLVDTWDFLWIYSCLANNALSITPKNNLIENIGHGEDATHTAFIHKESINNNKELLGPILHPNIMLPQLAFDNYIYKEVFNWKSFFEKITSIRHIFKVIKNRFYPIK